MIKPWLYLAGVSLLLGAYGYGRYEGAALCGASYTEAALNQAAANAKANAALMLAEQENRRLAQSLEDAANEEPVSNPTCFPASRVRRLNLR